MDLRKVSILQKLTEQYLRLHRPGRAPLRIELGPDYLVMAAVARLPGNRACCCPPTPPQEGPERTKRWPPISPFSSNALPRLRDAPRNSWRRDRLFKDRFPRRRSAGGDEPPAASPEPAGLLDLMQAYARIRTRDDFRPYVMDRDAITDQL